MSDLRRIPEPLQDFSSLAASLRSFFGEIDRQLEEFSSRQLDKAISDSGLTPAVKTRILRGLAAAAKQRFQARLCECFHASL